MKSLRVHLSGLWHKNGSMFVLWDASRQLWEVSRFYWRGRHVQKEGHHNEWDTTHNCRVASQ